MGSLRVARTRPEQGSGIQAFCPEKGTEDGCLLWGSRVVVPQKGRARVLRMLHEAHPGIAHMKGLARGYVWWPSIDEELEKCVKCCETCQENRKSPPVAPMHAWSWPDKPWARVHIDYAGPFMGKMFLLLIDAHSKWLEVHMTTSSTSATTIALMRKTFASLGLPEVIVSDNAANFTSEEFQEFLRRNGVKHIRTPPYHPASNCLVERAVQTLKRGLKMLTNGSLDTKLSRFLFKYRITPQSSTGISPAELMFGRRLRSQFDNLHPDLSRKARQTQDQQARGHDVRAKARDFDVGNLVYARNYASGPTWLPGEVVEKHGSSLYTVLRRDGRRVRKHVDQLLARTVRKSLQGKTQELPDESGEPDCDNPVQIREEADADPVFQPSPRPNDQLAELEQPFVPPQVVLPELPEVRVHPAAPAVESPEHELVEPPRPPIAPRRSSRTVRPPERYGFD